MSEPIKVTTDLTKMVCVSCGTPFCMDGVLRTLREGDHRPFYCPNGHEQHFTGENNKQIIARLEARIKELEKELADQQVYNRQLKCKLVEAENQLKVLKP